MSDRLYLEVNGTDVDEDWGDPVVQDQPTEDWGDPVAENPAAPVVAAAIKSNPDQAARARAISQQTQVPADIVERNLPEMEQRVRAEQVSQIAQQDSAIERTLADPETAKIAHDDVESLSLLGQVGRAFVAFPRAIGAAIPRVNQGLWGVARAAADVVGAEGAADFAAARAGEQEKFAESLSPKTGNWALDAATGGVTSFAQSMMMLPFGSVGVLSSFGLVSGGESYSKARDEGKDVATSLAFGGAQGGIEVMTERLPVKHLLDAIGGRQTLLNGLKKFAISEGIGEQIATLWQDFNEWVVLNPEKSVQDFIAERPQRAAETLISTIVSVGASSTVAHSVSALQERKARAQQAPEAAKHVADLTAASEGSKLRARDPEAFKRFMADAMTDETGDRPDLYIDGQVFAQSLEAAGLPLERLAQVAPNLAQQVAEATQLGGDVVLPADEFASTLAGTPLAPALLPHIRTAPDAMSVAEAEVFAQNEPVLFQEATEQAIAQQMNDQVEQLDEDTVFTQMLDRLNRAGRFTEDVNRAYAAVPTAIIKTMAARMGMTATDFADRWMPRVVSENPAAPGEVLNDRGFDYPVVNIGLATNDGGAITADEAIAALRSIGVEVVETAQHESDTEQTLVARLSRPLTPEEGEALSVALRQDAVAQAFGTTGDLFGPKKDDWGPFNPQFFLTLDGRRASESELLNQTPGALPLWSLERAKGARISAEVKKGSISLAPKATLARKNYEKLDAIFAKVPNPLESEESWRKWMSLLVADRDVLGVPYNALKYAQSPEAVAEYLSRLRPDQLESRRAGFELGARIRQEYAEGRASPIVTGRLLLWAMLSRMAGAYPHEAAYMDLVNGGVDQWIEKAVNGTWTQADSEAYVKWSSDFMASKKGGASPGAGVTSNANDFGRILLTKMSEKDANGETQLTRLHNLIADPNVSTSQVRREFFALGDALGIQNKVLSFALLVTGRWDTLVLDRVQFTHLWGDQYRERAGQRNIYDNGLAAAGEGHFGLAVYEALERGMSESLRKGYALAGLTGPGDGTLGAFHWDSWLIESSQAIGHPTVEALDTERPRPDLAVRQGKFDTYSYNFEYRADGQYQIPFLDGSGYVILSPAEASEFQRRLGDPNEGVVPKDFKVSQNKQHPWVDAEGVNRGRYDEILAGYGRRADAGDVAPAGSADASGPLQQSAADGQPEPQFNQDFVDRPGSLTRRTPEFKRWFAGSKVVDENGEPLVVYHGSLRDFDAFDMNAARDGAHFFTPLSQHAAFFGDVRGFYVSIKNPLVISQDDLNAAWDAEHPDGEQDDRSLLPRDFVKDFVARAKAGGHDGLVIEQFGDLDYTTDVYLPFDANQIKSVDNTAPTSSSNVYAQSAPPSRTPEFPRIDSFGGLKLRRSSADIRVSAASAFADGPFTIQPGVREIPLADVTLQDSDALRSEPEQARIAALAEAIKKNGSIEPLFVAQRADGSRYVAEGQHRARALRLLGYDSIPARVMVEGAGFRAPDLLMQSAPPTKGIHFSHAPRTILDGRYYGRGMKGDEAARLANATDRRIRDRVYVYIDRGQGILPEQGVGGFAHEVDLPPLYDASRDPLGLKRGVDANTFESRVLDAGYAGYWVEGFTRTQDAAVIMGPASHGLAARAVPPPARPGGVAIAAPQRYSTALTSKEIEIVRDNFDALRDEVPSIKERFGTLTMETQDLPAAIAALSKLGVQLPSESLQQAVWHGSPHSFVRFSFDFIGTGEGAQAFGWGLYFAENRDTAKFYHSILAGLPPVRRIKLGTLTFGEFDGFDYSRRAGKNSIENIRASIAESLLIDTKLLYENRDRFRERVKDEIDWHRADNQNDPERLRAVDFLERELMAPGALDLQFAEAEGAVYKLEIPDEAIERMLVWDKPLSGQSAFAKKALVSTVRDLKTWNHNGITYPNPEALTMEGFYGALERQFGSDKAASEYLNSLGIPGMRYLDGMSRSKGEGHHNIVVWDQALLDKMNEQVEAQLPQQTSDAPRGTFNPSTNTIALLERADLSTFLHETGHWALEMLVDLAAQPGAPTQVVDDARTLLSWAGVESLQAWQKMSLEQRRAAHEKVAEGFETYLFEGKAPSAELQGAFARFRAWMLNVYKSLTRMRVQLTPEVRSVFDRMLATDEQIAEMSRVREMAPMFESAEAAGMTPEDFAAYLKLGEKAANDATADLTARTLRDMKWLSNAKGRALKKLQDSAKELRKGIRAEVETEVDAQPVYAAIAFIEKGLMAERDLTNAQRKALESIAGGKTKLDLAVLKDLYGEDPAAPWRYLKQTLVAAEGGAHPDAVAEAFGFDSGDALVRAILAAEPRQQLVEGLTDQRMLERHGDLTDSESMERAAEMAIHNEARTRFVATEMRTLAEALNPREKVGETTVTRGKHRGQTRNLTVNALMRAAKSYADQIVARTVVRKLSPARHASTAAKEARAAREALAAGKIELALQHKRNQLLHERTSRAMADAQIEFEKMQAYLRKFRNNRARGAIDADYVEQIENVLAAVDTRNATNKRLDSLQSLREWKTAQEEQGLPVVLDPDLVATMNVTNLRDMTMEQLRGLVDQVKSIEHLGKLKKKLLTARDQREFEAIRDEVAATIRANGGKPRDVPFNPSAHDQAWWKSWRGFFAEHRKFASLVRQFDGVVDNGPIWRVLVRGMNDAGNREQALLMDATKKLGAIFAPLEKMKGGLTGDKRLITSLGKSLSRGDRIAVALNWGNELNRARVLNTLTQPQVDEIFSMLTREEWTAVQAIWDHLNEYWPDIAAKEKRVTGTAPEKVESAPFTAVLQDGSTVDLAGGYYPIAYESELSDVAAAHQQAQIAKDMMAGAYTRATTRRGHTQKRAQNVSEPLTWSLTVIDRHVNQVVHDLAWHEWLIDAGRILRDREVAGAIRAHYGNETLRTMKQALQDIAVGDLQTAGAVGRLVAGLRARASAATMGWSITTALLQPFGILQSIPRVGSKWILKGMRHWAGDLARFENSAAKIREKSPMMRHRTTTFNRDIREVMGRVHRGDSKAKQVFDASLFFAMQKLQLMADVPTWWGAYEKALADGVDEDTAVALADQAVLDAQGSGMTKDLAGVQRGGELQKALSMFYSYFSATWNMMSESTARTDFRNPVQVAGWLADMAALVVVPALGPAVLLAALQGGDDDEDKETGEILADAGLEVLGFLMGTLIGVREFSGFAKGYSYSGPAFTRAIKDVGDAASKSLPKVVDEDEELEETDYRRIVKAFLVALGLPATQVDRSWRGWRAWQDGEAGPAAILVGPPPKD